MGGFKCPRDNCASGVYHAKCIELLRESKECTACQNKWSFDPTTKLGLLSDPKLSETIIADAMMDRVAESDDESKEMEANNHNRNRKRNRNTNSNQSQSPSEEESEDLEMSQSQRPSPRKRRRTNNVVNDEDSETESD